MNSRDIIRFAVVMNGGVSLAVWMGGVTHELNRLRLASTGADGRPAEPAEAAVHDAWVNVLDRAARTIVVDTIAGTSAGGINATLLAAAIAGGHDLPDMKTTWAETAALEPGRLLYGPEEYAPSHRKPSYAILNGEFFHRELRRLLTELTAGQNVSEPQDCTLLVTATALHTQPVSVQLERQGSASMRDSRRVYRFQRHTNDLDQVRDDFATGREYLALAARASASFPVAFEPVRETSELSNFGVSPTGKDQSSMLIDGGVLDNAPFEPLLEVLRSRSVGAPFDRVLLYITPSPDITSAVRGNEGLDAGRVVSQVITTMREPDQRLDFESLQHSFERMGLSISAPHDAITRLLLSPHPRAFIDTTQAAVAAGNWFTTYRHSRAEATERELESLDGRIRFVAPTPATLSPDDLRSVPKAQEYPASGWDWGLATAERTLRWWGRALVAYTKIRSPRAAATPAFGEIQKAQRRMVRLREQLNTHLDIRPATSLQVRAERMNASYSNEMQEEIRATLEGAATAITALAASDGLNATSLLDFTLSVEVASAALSWSSMSSKDTPQFTYQQITPAARSIVDLGDVMGEQGWLNRKLYGERWARFGAFASPRGREADWLWGRLDGASALCDQLLSGADDAEQLKHDLATAILAAEGSSESSLRAAVAQADKASNRTLLNDLSPVARRTTAGLLWRQVIELVRTASPGTARYQDLARAFADPTWKARSGNGTRSWRASLGLRLVRIYGWPVRRAVRRGVRTVLDSGQKTGR